MENLRIPEKYRRTGLYIYCYKCKAYSNIKDGSLKKSSSCSHPPDRQVYKLKIHMPGTKNMSRTKILDTRDIKEVDKLRLEFIEQLKNNNYNTSAITIPEISDGNKYLLTYQMKRYLDYITNGGFYEFEAPRELSIGTIKDYKRNFRYFIDSIASTIDIKTIRIDEIKMEHLELFHKYIRKKSSSDKTYDNIISSLKTFYNHLINYERLDVENVFKHVPVHTIQYDPQTYSEEEFNKVLAVTKIENGYDPIRRRSRYREWLPTSFKLGLFTGLRLDELVHIKFCDIVEVNGDLILESDNEKANKLIKRNSNKRIKRLPVIPELLKVLNEECDFELNKNADRFIIAPEMGRSTVNGIITKGFTHFKRLADIDDSKCFKELRTTYISALQDQYGDIIHTSTISDHSNKEVLRKHYLAQINAVKKCANFRIF
jgi:integrase